MENQKKKRNNNQNFPQVDENFNFIKSIKIFRHKKQEENYINAHHNISQKQ